jgi:hypothetical protein
MPKAIKTQRKKRLVNVYSKTGVQKDWIALFNRLEKGETFQSIADDQDIPVSTLKGRYYKFQKDPEREGFVDRRFSGLASKSWQTLSREEEIQLDLDIQQLRKRGFKVTRGTIRKRAIKLFPQVEVKKFNIYWAAKFAQRYKYVKRKATQRKKAWKESEWTELAQAFRDECGQIRYAKNLSENQILNVDETRVVFGWLMFIFT